MCKPLPPANAAVAVHHERVEKPVVFNGNRVTNAISAPAVAAVFAGCEVGSAGLLAFALDAPPPTASIV